MDVQVNDESKDRLHTIISVNLRKYCARMDSIAEVCRKAELNRQQFNKYISGENLPSLVTLQKLATALGVGIEDLIAEPKIVSDNISNMGLEELCEEMTHGMPDDVEEGFYLEVSASDIFEGLYLCAITQMRKFEDKITYKRKFPIQSNEVKNKYWTYHGYAYRTYDATSIIYVNSSLRMNIGYYHLLRANAYSHDLVGNKYAISSMMWPRPYASITYFLYLGKKINIREHFERCGVIDPTVCKDEELLRVCQKVKDSTHFANGMLTVSF